MFLSLLQVCNPITENAFILCPVTFLDLTVYKTFRWKVEDPYPIGGNYVHYYSRNVKRNSNREQDPRLLQVSIYCVKMLCFLGLHNTIFDNAFFCWKCLCTYKIIDFFFFCL